MTPFHLTLLICLAVLMIASLIGLIIVVVNYRKMRSRASELEKYNQKLAKENKEKESTYSEDVLKFIRMFTTQVTILKFNEYVDNREVEKVTKENIKHLIEDISRVVHNSINTSVLDFDSLLFTEEFYESYIISIAVETVKDLLSKRVDEI